MIKFVIIDSKYMDALRSVDEKVFINSPTQHKENRPYIGILINIENIDTGKMIEYFAPLSSPKEKHKKMTNMRDFHKIYSRSKELIGVINFNNMVPVTSDLYNVINIPENQNKTVLQEEYIFCNKQEELLCKKAEKLYTLYIENKLTEKEEQRVCDFLALEEEMEEYLEQEPEYEEECEDDGPEMGF